MKNIPSSPSHWNIPIVRTFYTFIQLEWANKRCNVTCVGIFLANLAIPAPYNPYRWIINTINSIISRLKKPPKWFIKYFLTGIFNFRNNIFHCLFLHLCTGFPIVLCHMLFTSLLEGFIWYIRWTLGLVVFCLLCEDPADFEFSGILLSVTLLASKLYLLLILSTHACKKFSLNFIHWFVSRYPRVSIRLSEFQLAHQQGPIFANRSCHHNSLLYRAIVDVWYIMF